MSISKNGRKQHAGGRIFRCGVEKRKSPQKSERLFQKGVLSIRGTRGFGVAISSRTDHASKQSCSPSKRPPGHLAASAQG